MRHALRTLLVALGCLIGVAAHAVGPNCPLVQTDCAGPFYYQPTFFAGATFSPWTTPTRPATPNTGECNFNSTSGAWECWSGLAWVSSGGGGTPGGTNGQIQYNQAGAFGGLTNAQLTALVGIFSPSASGAVPSPGSLGATFYLNAAGGWTVPATGGGSSFVGGSNVFFSTNVGSSVGGAFSAIETAWSPAVVSGGNSDTPGYDYNWQNLTMGLSNRGATTVTDWWNTFLHANGSYVSLSTTTANAHEANYVAWMIFPNGLGNGCEGGPASGGGCTGAPWDGVVTNLNPNYQEGTQFTGISEFGSAGHYSESIASYNYDYLVASPSTSYATRVNAFSAFMYKNNPSNTYNTWGFVASSNGLTSTISAEFTGSISGTTLSVSGVTVITAPITIGQEVRGASGSVIATITGGSGSSWSVTPSQSAVSQNMTSDFEQFAPTAAFAVNNAWLYGLDFRLVTNVPGFIFAELPNGSGSSCCAIANDATDLQFFVGAPTYPIENLSAVAVSFTTPLFMDFGGVNGTMPTLTNVGGTLTGAICGSSTGGFYQSPSANCYAGGGTAGGSPGQVQFNSSGSLGGLTNTQLTALVNVFTTSLNGAVPTPASALGASYYLDATGNWSIPAGGSGCATSGCTYTGAVTFSAGLQTSAITFSGGATLAQNYGGFGYDVTTSATNGSLCIGHTGFGCENSTISNGTDTTVANGVNSIAINYTGDAATTSYTPTITASGGSVVASSAVGTYMRDGNLIKFDVVYTLSSASGSGGLLITTPTSQQATGSLGLAFGEHNNLSVYGVPFSATQFSFASYLGGSVAGLTGSGHVFGTYYSQ